MEINPRLVRKLVSEQFPKWKELPIWEVAFSGWDNRTFHLGDQLSVRLPSHQRYAAQVEKEHRWLPLLAKHLPLPIPEPVAMGKPTEDFPLHWSIYRWLKGENTTFEKIHNICGYAEQLGLFLKSLYAIDASHGPAAGEHNFYRGGPLNVYRDETLQTIQALGDRVDGKLALQIWQEGLSSTWSRKPVWVHGDISSSNLLLVGGELSAVIDFGCMGVGDPACDLTIAWTLFDQEGRVAFRTAINLDDGTWSRARGWALWKALIVLEGNIDSDPQKASEANRVIRAVMQDYLDKQVS
jgi:aminoglycoside phosphotransferase (APT) family kinase protein